MLLARIELLDERDESERRTDPRQGVGKPSTARGPDDAAVDVVVKDLSASGLSFTAAAKWEVQSRISVGLAGPGRVSGTIVRREGDIYGCAFDRALTPQQLANAFSANSSPARDLAFRQHEFPLEEKWPARTRLLVMIGLGLCAWGVVLWLAFS